MQLDNFQKALETQNTDATASHTMALQSEANMARMQPAVDKTTLGTQLQAEEVGWHGGHPHPGGHWGGHHGPFFPPIVVPVPVPVDPYPYQRCYVTEPFPIPHRVRVPCNTY